tara:strand:- start:282 stop:569 length:288 start_codon:yes stop_codon:yes gene_type:complete
MHNILLIIILVIVFLIILFFFKRNKRSVKKIITTSPYIPFLKEKEFNPDISTDNWDLHRLRLEKFRRSQYKGLTFFITSGNRIYYLSEEGDKIYC